MIIHIRTRASLPARTHTMRTLSTATSVSAAPAFATDTR